MVVLKKRKVHVIAFKVLMIMMFLFFRIQMNSDILFVKQEDNVVSAELEP